MVETIKIDYGKIAFNDNVKAFLDRNEQVKKAISVLRPFEDIDILEQIKSFYKTDCVWSSEALEGNSITKGETQVMIEEGVTVEGHPLSDILRTTGHIEAFDKMFDMLNNNMMSVDDIKSLHRIVLSKDRPDIAGNYKVKPNMITGSNFSTVSPANVSSEMQKFDKWMRENYSNTNPILFAAEVHRKLVYIHPFSDGNGRTARLAMNAILIQNGYLPVAISPYMKLDYNSALELGRQGDKDAFYAFVAEAEYETQKDFCRHMAIDIPKIKGVGEQN